mmetsp:Transcript_39896/g.80470  ORF Transcript_39896/g.80470 Transcript_39896/m.80470 type:complete len:212 (-) Transcript_39896:1192-1827(-)
MHPSKARFQESVLGFQGGHLAGECVHCLTHLAEELGFVFGVQPAVKHLRGCGVDRAGRGTLRGCRFRGARPFAFPAILEVLEVEVEGGAVVEVSLACVYVHHVVQVAEPHSERGAVADGDGPKQRVHQLLLEVLAAELAGVVLPEARHEVAHRAHVHLARFVGVLGRERVQEEPGLLAQRSPPFGALVQLLLRHRFFAFPGLADHNRLDCC